MQPITIRGLDGPAVTGTVWIIGEGQRDLEEVSTRQQAVKRARNTWAAPGQPIKVVNTKGKIEMVREGDPSRQPSSGGGNGGGLFDNYF